MTHLFSLGFSSGGVVLTLIAGTLWLWVRPQSKGPRVFLLVVAVGYGLSSIFAIDHWAVRSLSSGFRPLTAADVPAGRTAVVVMGSGSFTARDWDNNEYSITDTGAASRVAEAARVFRIVKPEVVISSGGKTDPLQRNVATGVAMRDALLKLGVPESQIVLQTNSRNTREEALANLQISRSLKIEHIVVVTSDFHMRRTVGAFRAAGVEVIPAIAREPWEARFWFEQYLPSEHGLMMASLATHEFIGLGYYRARGWYR